MSVYRPKFKETGFPVLRGRTSFGGVPIEVPLFETEITPRENYIRSATRNNPLWVPNHFTDAHVLYIDQLGQDKNGKLKFGPDFIASPNYDYSFTDHFGNSWTWVASAQGAMLTPGTRLVDDILDWEKYVKWPNLDDWTIRETAADFMKNIYDSKRLMHVNIHQGLTEMLVAVLGGYGEAMLALAEEPEACAAFFEAYTEYEIGFFDYLHKLYPIDMVTYHDDWGTERATFFSRKMLEELILEPTRCIVDHIKSKGVLFELHTCGKIDDFIPQMCDLGINYIQIQRRAVDIPKMKLLYGDRIGFNTTPEDYEVGSPYTEQEVIDRVRRSVDLYAKGGGYYPWIFETDPERLWTICTELYAYSREYYES